MVLFRFRQAVALAVTALSLGATVPANALPDARDGHRLAMRWCVACHVVGPDQQRAGDAAPTFARIARINGFDKHKLEARLIAPHPPMPALTLSDEEIDALVAYIQTLH